MVDRDLVLITILKTKQSLRGSLAYMLLNSDP